MCRSLFVWTNGWIRFFTSHPSFKNSTIFTTIVTSSTFISTTECIIVINTSMLWSISSVYDICWAFCFIYYNHPHFLLEFKLLLQFFPSHYFTRFWLDLVIFPGEDHEGRNLNFRYNNTLHDFDFKLFWMVIWDWHYLNNAVIVNFFT